MALARATGYGRDAFRFENRNLVNARVRLSCLISAPLFLLFGTMDYLQERNLFPLFLGIRILVSLLLLAVFLASQHPELENIADGLGVLVWCSLGIALAVMTGLTEHYTAMYTQGLFLILVGVGLIMPWRPRFTAVTVGTVYLSYLGFNFGNADLRDSIFINNNLFLLTIAVLSYTATSVGYRLRLNEFNARVELDSSNKALEVSKNALAQSNSQLRERTADLEAANTQLVASNQQIAAADRAKTRFLANMSHELRTPLNSIIGFSRVLLKGIDGPVGERQREDLEAIHYSGQHLLGLITELLDLSKIEAGKMDLAQKPVDLEEIIRGVMSTAQALVKDKAVELKVHVAPQLHALMVMACGCDRWCSIW